MIFTVALYPLHLSETNVHTNRSAKERFFLIQSFDNQQLMSLKRLLRIIFYFQGEDEKREGSVIYKLVSVTCQIFDPSFGSTLVAHICIDKKYHSRKNVSYKVVEFYIESFLCLLLFKVIWHGLIHRHQITPTHSYPLFIEIWKHMTCKGQCILHHALFCS